MINPTPAGVAKLPKFNRDGTHEPWKDQDVPWANAAPPTQKSV